MRKLIAFDLQPGMIAAEPVFTNDGRQVLIQTGQPLTDRVIEQIQNWGIPFVMVAEAIEAEMFAEQEVSKAAVSALPEVAVSALPEVIVKRTVNFANNLEEVSIRTTQAMDDVRTSKVVEIDVFKEIAAKVAQHLIQPSEAINKLLFGAARGADREYLERHSVAVAALSGMLAYWMELKPDGIGEVVFAGLLHDIGKANLPRSLAADKNPTPDRQELLMQHVSFAQEMLGGKGLPKSVHAAIVQHHEYMDGSGFPLGLSAGEIHPYARIIAVANRLCHIVDSGAGLNPFAMAETIKTEMFTKLDPTVCDTFNRRINDYLMKNPVKLSDGRKAQVVFLPSVNPTSPVLKTEDESFIDLTKTKDVCIVGLTF